MTVDSPYTTASEQVVQARQTFGFAWLPNVSIINCHGSDALAFLQNRLTNDVSSLEQGMGQLNTALDRQGKVQGVFSLHARSNGELFMLINQAEAEHCRSAILQYKIVEDIQLTPQQTLKCLTIQGAESLSFLQKQVKPTANPHETLAIPSQPYAHCKGVLFDSTVHLIACPWSTDTGYLILAEQSEAETLYENFKKAIKTGNAVELSEEALSTLRIEAGLPVYGKEYSHDTLLPETGLHAEAVSYNKGCYLGQETIARIKTYGTLQKALTGLVFDPSIPVEEGCAIQHAETDKPVGTITSVTYSPCLKKNIAIAALLKSFRTPGQTLALKYTHSVEETVVTFQATVQLLPFYDGKKSSKTADELLQEGLNYFTEGFDLLAITSLEQAIQLNPDCIDARESLGVILARQNRFEEAIEQMHTILEIDSNHVLAHTNLSMFHMKMGNIAAAEDEKAKATMAAFKRQAKASGLVFDVDAERVKKEKLAQEKVDMFLEALKHSPDDPLGNFGLASAYMDLNQQEQAIEPFKKVLQVQPKHSVAYLSLGKCFEAVSDIKKAVETYQTGIAIAADKGDMMPLQEMQSRLEVLGNH